MKIIALLSLVAVVSAATTHPFLIHFMDDTTPVGRIVGGQEARNASEFPFQLLFQYQRQFSCGGVIISNQFALTAAHCVDNRQASAMTVVAGSHLASGEGGKTYNVRRAIRHENYGDFKNDIALLQIDGLFEFSELIQPILLDEEGPEVGEEVLLMGFGRTSTGGAVSQVLKWVKSSPIPDDECFAKTRIRDNSVICFYNAPGQGICQGDSGGPAIHIHEEDGESEPRLVGLASFTVGGCATGNPDGYNYVPEHIDWIREKMQSFYDPNMK